MHQKCSNSALTNLLFGLCKSMWVIDLLVILLAPYPEVSACLSNPKVLRARERAPTPSPSVIFTFKLVVESIKESGSVSCTLLLSLWNSLGLCQYDLGVVFHELQKFCATLCFATGKSHVLIHSQWRQVDRELEVVTQINQVNMVCMIVCNFYMHWFKLFSKCHWHK
jgi:hypothetical protein